MIGRSLSLLLILSMLVGCGDPDDPHSQDKLDSKRSNVVKIEEEQSQLMKQVAIEYLNYKQLLPGFNMAPAMCKARMNQDIRFSYASEESLHGKKLYKLYCNMPAEYKFADREASPVGMTLVKQAWQACVVEKPGSSDDFDLRNELGFWKQGVQKQLFIMKKLEPSTINTDAGWVYGVVDPGGNKVE